MKKLAFAAAALAAAPWVHAQSSVSIVGLVDEYVGSMRYAGDPGRTNLL